jgi:2-amino-4-hydroxy-6-hydroxymethyldihydropteridine diphosphokinase
MNVYVGLGGNVGDSVMLLHRALDLISEHSCIHGVRSSALYRSVAVSPEPQCDFVNAVCVFTTTLSSLALLHYLQSIEQQLGKLPKAKTAPRPIDLDILLYGMEMVQLPDLQVPHPFWSERLFVLLPMAELVAELWVPAVQGVQHVDLSVEIAKLIAAGVPAVWPLSPNERIDPCDQ